MVRYLKLILFCFAFLLWTIEAFGSPFYVDLDAGSNGTGTYASPFNSVAAVNNASKSTGDDVYFKVGTSETFDSTTYLLVDWSGTAEDRVIIGAYSAEGVYELNGNARPTFNGAYTSDPPPNSTTETGNIEVRGDYVTVQDLKVYQGQGTGMRSWGADNVIFDNVYIEETWKQGVHLYNGSNCVLQNSEVINTGRSGNGASIIMQKSFDAIVRDNIIHDSCYIANGGSGREGINFIYAYDAIAENNIIYNTRGMGIYFDHANRCTARYNLIYYDSDDDAEDCWRNTTRPSSGIVFTDESTAGRDHTYAPAQGNSAIGNYIAGCGRGFSLWSGAGNTLDPGLQNVRIVDNIIVEPQSSDSSHQAFNFNASANNSNTTIKNNIIWQTSGTLASVQNDSDITWDYQLWNSAPESDAQGTNDLTYAAPNISKTTNWGSITPGGLSIADFELQQGSTAIDAATHWTTTNGSGSSSTSLTLTDWLYFHAGDSMYIEDTGVVTISSMDRATGAIVLTAPATWGDNKKVYSPSNYSGAFPDLGPHEYSGLYQNTAPSFSVVAPGSVTLYADGGAGWNEISASCTAADAEGTVDAFLWTFEVSYITDGNMETDPTTNWSANGATLAEETTIKNGGSKSLKITDNGSYSSAYQPITTEIGVKYTTSGYLYRTNGDRMGIKAATAYDGTGVISSFMDETNTGSWENLELTFTATATTTYIIAALGGTDGVLYIDDWDVDMVSTSEDPGTITIPDPGSYPTTINYNVKAQDNEGLWSAPVQHTVTVEETTPAGGSCAEFYAPTLTKDANVAVGRLGAQDFVGFKYTTGGSAENVCEVDVYCDAVVGTLGASNDYYLRIFNLDGSNQITTTVATSAKIDGDSLVGGTWISANAGRFVFSSAAALSASTSYGFGIFPDTDSNLTDNPEVNSSNFWRLGLDDENNGDSTQEGFYAWDFSGGTVTTSDIQDDILVKIHTESGTTLSEILGITADGSYKQGDAIIIALVYDQATDWTSSDILTLDTGGTATLSYPEGASGTAQTLYFTYTVGAGQNSADLNVSSGTVDGNAISLPTGENLADNAAIIIDTTAATITDMYSCDSGGTEITAETTLTTGDVVYCAVVFSEAQNVIDGAIGNLGLQLDMGYPGDTVYATYYSGLGTSKIIVSYTVQAGDRDLDLDVPNTSALIVNRLGTTIKLIDPAGNESSYTLPHTDLIDVNDLIIAGEKTFNIGTGGDYDSITAAEAAGWYPVPGDSVTMSTHAKSYFFWTPTAGGGAGDLVTLDFSALTSLERLTFNGDYFDLLIPAGVKLKTSGTGTQVRNE